MAYHVDIDREALKAIAELPKKIQRQIADCIDSLARDPFPSDAEQIKGQNDIWRIKSCNYRIAYTVHEGILHILILRVGHRKDFYRYFDR
jgi:mRNA interferase RelE/StbE